MGGIDTTFFAIVPVDLQSLVNDEISENLIERDHLNIKRWIHSILFLFSPSLIRVSLRRKGDEDKRNTLRP